MKNKYIINSILILSIILIIFLIYIKFFSKDINIKPFGIEVLEVLSNSMNPEFKKRDIIIIKEEKEYNIGDIITYENENGVLVTHRIIEKDKDVFFTKGDNNNTKDEIPISQKNIRGKVIFTFKH